MGSGCYLSVQIWAHDGVSALSFMHIAVVIGFRHCMFNWFVLGFGQIGLD